MGSGSSRPPSPAALLAELGGAVVGGIVLAVLFALGLGLLMRGSELGMGVLTLQVFAGLFGLGLGAGGGAALAGRLFNQRGSAPVAMIAAVLAAIVAALVLRYVTMGGLFAVWGIGGAALVIALAAVGGYNLRRAP